MSKKLRVWYQCGGAPKELPDETQNAIIVVPGEKWVLVCNSEELRRGLFTSTYSQFVSGPPIDGYEQYPTAELDQEGVDLQQLKQILVQMGFKLQCPLLTPVSWH